MLRSLMKPSYQRQSADQEKQVQGTYFSFLEWPVLLVAIEKRSTKACKVRVVFFFKQGRCDVVHMPSVSRIIKIYHCQLAVFINDIFRIEISVDETECRGFHAMATESNMNLLARSLQEFAFGWG